jgi:predicted DCC family thiol-disulfide oxidoreductase YuxK
MKNRINNPVVFYDSDCGFCTRTVIKVSHMKLISKIDFIGAQSAEKYELDSGILLELQRNSDRYMYYLNYPKSDYYKGSDAFAMIFKNHTRYKVIGTLLQAPILRIFFRSGYYVIAKNRKRLSGPDATCGI